MPLECRRRDSALLGAQLTLGHGLVNSKADTSTRMLIAEAVTLVFHRQNLNKSKGRSLSESTLSIALLFTNLSGTMTTSASPDGRTRTSTIWLQGVMAGEG